MRCRAPRTVGFQHDGKTIAWSQKQFSKEYAAFQLPCGKCIECRLEYARQWAVRCVHEAKMHPENSFITLTYADEHLESPKLIYSDFQKFAKRLRRSLPHDQRIGYFVTGEYGDGSKRPVWQKPGRTKFGEPVQNRPHWHAIVFNWSPSDRVFDHSNHRGDRVYVSESLTRLWGKGRADLGSVTFESAGYVARYAAKKLTFGDDGHEFEPISKKSSKHAIGRTFLETYWTDIFNHGKIILPDGNETTIPRYYEKWLKEHHFSAWTDYVQSIKFCTAERAEKRKLETIANLAQNSEVRIANGNYLPETTQADAERAIMKRKFELLNSHLKGDI